MQQDAVVVALVFVHLNQIGMSHYAGWKHSEPFSKIEAVAAGSIWMPYCSNRPRLQQQAL